MVRAFLRGIDYDPKSSSGKAHFWLIPNAEADDGQANPGGRGRRSDLGGNGGANHEGADGDGTCLLFPLVSGDTRYEKKRSAAQGDASSFHMVAGVPFVSEKKTRPCPWVRQILFKLGFERDLRPGECPQPRHLRIVPCPKKAKVAGSNRGRLTRVAR